MSFDAGRIVKVNKEEVMVNRVRVKMSEEGKEIGWDGEAEDESRADYD